MDGSIESLLHSCEDMLSEGQDLEEILSFLRRNKLSQIDSIKVLMNLKEMTLAEAKQTVHTSKTWEDMRENSERLHRSLQSALTESAKEDKGSN